MIIMSFFLEFHGHKLLWECFQWWLRLWKIIRGAWLHRFKFITNRNQKFCIHSLILNRSIILGYWKWNKSSLENDQKWERNERHSAQAVRCLIVLTPKTSSSSSTWVFLRNVKFMFTFSFTWVFLRDVNAFFGLFKLSICRQSDLKLDISLGIWSRNALSGVEIALMRSMLFKLMFPNLQKGPIKTCFEKYIWKKNSLIMDQNVDRNFLAISTATYGNCFTFNSW